MSFSEPESTGHVCARILEVKVATKKAVSNAYPGRRDQNQPCVRAANTVKKSESEIFKYIMHLIWLYDKFGRFSQCFKISISPLLCKPIHNSTKLETQATPPSKADSRYTRRRCHNRQPNIGQYRQFEIGHVWNESSCCIMAITCDKSHDIDRA